MDQLLTESTLEAAIQRKNQLQHTMDSAGEDIMTDFSCHWMDVDVDLSQRKMVDCRLCHDEDEESNMEVPCFERRQRISRFLSRQRESRIFGSSRPHYK